MIFRSSVGWPSPARDWSFWLQLREGGEWMTLCALRPDSARDVARWMDRHPLRMDLRIWAERVGLE